jgi:hypothetical protein
MLAERRRDTKAELAFLADVRSGLFAMLETASIDLDRISELGRPTQICPWAQLTHQSLPSPSVGPAQPSPHSITATSASCGPGMLRIRVAPVARRTLAPAFRSGAGGVRTHDLTDYESNV